MHYARGDAGPAGHRSLRSLGSELNLCAAGDRLQVRPVGERIDLVDECEAECESCAEVKFLFVRRCAEIWGDKRGDRDRSQRFSEGLNCTRVVSPVFLYQGNLLISVEFQVALLLPELRIIHQREGHNFQSE